MDCCVFERIVTIDNPPRGNYTFLPSLLFTQQKQKGEIEDAIGEETVRHSQRKTELLEQRKGCI